MLSRKRKRHEKTILSSLLIGLLTFGIEGCSSSSDEPEKPEEQKPNDNNDNNKEEETKVDWQKVANLSSSSLLDFYWNKQKNFFNYYPSKADTPAEDWHYWPQAHAMDVLIDAYIRTQDNKWKEYFSL